MSAWWLNGPGLRCATFLAPSLLPMYEAIIAAIGRWLDVPAELTVEDDYQRCLEDHHDVCFVCSLPHVIFERDGRSPAVPVAAPVLVGDRYRDEPIYFSDVIVARDSPNTTFLDLRDRSWAFNEKWSQSGYGVIRHHLVTLGETDGFFSKVVESGSHEQSIRMVASGDVDAAGIDSHALAVELRDDPSLADQLNVIETLGPSTIQPVTVSKRLPLEIRHQIQDALCDIHLDPDVQPHLGRGLIDRFVAVGPASYDDVSAMVEACEQAGFMELA